MSLGLIGVDLSWGTALVDEYGGECHPNNRVADNVWFATRTDLWSGPQIVCEFQSQSLGTAIFTVGKVLELMRVARLLPVSPVAASTLPADAELGPLPVEWRWEKHSWLSDARVPAEDGSLRSFVHPLTQEHVREMRAMLPSWSERDSYLDAAVQKLEEALLCDIPARSVAWAIAAMNALVADAATTFEREQGRFVAHAVADLVADHPTRLRWVRRVIKQCYSKIRSEDFHRATLEYIDGQLDVIGRARGRTKDALIRDVLVTASQAVVRFHERLQEGTDREAILQLLRESYARERTPRRGPGGR